MQSLWRSSRAGIKHFSAMTILAASIVDGVLLCAGFQSPRSNGGGFIGMYMLGIFTRRANSIGVIVGALASVVVTALTSRFTEVHYMFLNPVAILTCIGVGYTVSLLTPGNRKADLTGLTVWNLR